MICMTAASIATINLHLILGIEVVIEVVGWDDIMTLLRSIDVFICLKLFILLVRYLSLS